MKAIRKINNNVIVCIDSLGREVVAMGKGLGFQPVPREVSLKEIERTFYDLDETQQYVIRDLDEKFVSLAGKIVDIAKNQLDYELSPNIILNLADHISFMVERCRKRIKIKMPLTYDIEQYYPKECSIGRYVCKRIAKEYLVYVPDTEIAGVAMTFINAQVNGDKEVDNSTANFDSLLEDITNLVEDYFKIFISRDTFNYSRFATHVNYLFNRLQKNEMIESDNTILYNHIVESFPQIIDCVEQISALINEKCKTSLSQEEKLYLALHVNRIVEKESMHTD